MFKDIRRYENLHIAFWLVKDACWCLLFKPLGIMMIVPTLYVALDILWRTRKVQADFYHNLAISLWITANGIWMTGEFFFHDSLRPYAMIFFGMGLTVLAWYYLFLNKRITEAPKV
jgi:hypothetical protein